MSGTVSEPHLKRCLPCRHRAHPGSCFVLATCSVISFPLTIEAKGSDKAVAAEVWTLRGNTASDSLQEIPDFCSLHRQPIPNFQTAKGALASWGLAGRPSTWSRDGCVFEPLFLRRSSDPGSPGCVRALVPRGSTASPLHALQGAGATQLLSFFPWTTAENIKTKQKPTYS